MVKKYILNFLFPNKCVFCREICNEGEICPECAGRVQHLRIPDTARQINHKTFKKLDSCIAFYYYEDIARDGMLTAKNHGCDSFVKVFLQYISFDFTGYFKDNCIDVIISMPAHKSKYYQKEFDLPVQMATALTENSGIEYDNSLVTKVRKTKNQHKLKLEQRKSNLKEAFAVTGDVKGKNIVIVDDIITSGNSLEEVAKTLKKGGAAKVIAVTFAYNRL